jgi:hypothetical protein
MEDDAFGRCCVACMNRCADDRRRDPAICPGARGPRSAAGSAPPSAGPPTWSRPIGNSPLPFFTSPTIRSFPQGGRPTWNRCGGGAPRFPSDGGLNAAEAEEGADGCAGAAMPAGDASGTEAARRAKANMELMRRASERRRCKLNQFTVGSGRHVNSKSPAS